MNLRLFHFTVTSLALIAANAIYNVILTNGSFANFAHTTWMQVTALGIAAIFWPIHKPTEAQWVDSNH